MSDGATMTFVSPIVVRIGDTSYPLDVKLVMPLEQVEALIAEHRKAAR